MKYGIYFDNDASGDQLREALQATYGIEPALTYVGTHAGLNEYPGPDPVVVITPSTGRPFTCELSAGDAFASITRATELEVAVALCRATRTRALVDDGTPAPDYWFLVSRDGSYGRVFTDPEADDLVVLHAFEPISGEPDLPVVPPPDWARTW